MGWLGGTLVPLARAPIASLLGAALCTVALWCAPGGAEAAGSTPIWYVGAGADAADRAVEQVRAALGEPGAVFAEVTPLVDGLFDGVSSWPVGSAPTACAQTTTIKLETSLARAERALEEIEFEQAVEALAWIDGQLACVGGEVSPTSLGRASLMLGYLRHLTGDLEGAKQAFAQAAVFDPDVVWEANFSPQAQPAFNAAVLEALRTRDAHLRSTDGSWTLADVALDGEPLPTLGAVRPGEHQLALRRSDGSWLRLAIELPEARTLRIAPVTELVTRLDEDEFQAALAHALAARLESSGAEDAWVVDLTEGRIFRFWRDGQTLEEVEVRVARVKRPPRATDPGAKQGRKPPVAGPLLTLGGAVCGAVGLGIGIERRELALEIYEQVVAHNDQYDRHREGYETVTGEMTAAFVFAAVGGAALAVGVPTWIVQARGGKRTVALSASFGPGPGGVGGGSVWLVGRW